MGTSPQYGGEGKQRRDNFRKGTIPMSSDVDTTASGTISGPNPHERFIASLQARAEREGTTIGYDASMSAIDRIITAETADAVWDADEGGTVSGQAMVDIELRVHSITAAKSDDKYDATLGVFINIKATRLDTGDEVTINTGADKVVTKLVKFESMGMFPLECVIRGIDTRAGTMLVLRRIPARAVPGTTEPTA